MAAGIGDEVADIVDLECVDGWAAAVYTDSDGLTRPAILKAEGQLWILQDWYAVCEGDPMVPGDVAAYVLPRWVTFRALRCEASREGGVRVGLECRCLGPARRQVFQPAGAAQLSACSAITLALERTTRARSIRPNDTSYPCSHS
ncbi:MAG: hypothetical protein RLZZ362_1794 [Actinomycetota bacterium]